MRYFEIQERSDPGDEWDHITWGGVFTNIYKDPLTARIDQSQFTKFWPEREFRIITIGVFGRIKLWLLETRGLWRDRREYRRWKREHKES